MAKNLHFSDFFLYLCIRNQRDKNDDSMMPSIMTDVVDNR